MHQLPAAEHAVMAPPLLHCGMTCMAQIARQVFGKSWPPEPPQRRKEVIVAIYVTSLQQQQLQNTIV